MNARKNFKRSFDKNLVARPVPAAAQRGFAAWVDSRVARWLARSAANAVAAQRLFNADWKPTREFGNELRLVVSSPNWDESA
jgi:hypothetical protein